MSELRSRLACRWLTSDSRALAKTFLAAKPRSSKVSNTLPHATSSSIPTRSNSIIPRTIPASMAPSSSQEQKANRAETLTLNQLKALGEQLLSSRVHINNLPRLLSFLSPSSPPQFALESLLTLQSFFITLLPEIHSAPSRPKFVVPDFVREGGEDAEAVYRAWLRSRFDEFVNSLILVVVCPQSEEAVRDVFLDALMEFVKLGKGGRFQSALYHRFESALINVYIILSHVPALDGPNGDSGCEMWCEAGLVSKETDATPSSEATLVSGNSKKLKKAKSKVFVSLPQIVIPYVANPVILWSYDIGGVISVMALSSLFILITQHGVEYPHYYDKLYALLNPSIFMVKHRARFLQLLDTSLKSSHIPAYVAAAFTKKLSRLALSAPPSGSLVIIAIIHNLLRRHPSINFLVNQVSSNEANEVSTNGAEESIENKLKSESGLHVGVMKSGMDPFDLEECDLVKSNAMRSSLWEVDTMRHHYCPAVSRFVASLENDLTIRSKTSEVSVSDFCSGSYTTIFRDEIKRRIKQVPLAFYKATPTSLFSESDFTGWSFGDQLCNKEDGDIGNAAARHGETDLCHLTKKQKVASS
ncbi:hypothetical protein Taro_029171 [Colocasia esculenta]|uniref:CCAAT-binding factor domain-containing protein n=1 Tax=Colocasia esculenta TaxID=4460 RepID=A0A843VIA5_COLES|nr:hypothetical protein [Colocasia esculenta]